jgi:predicted Zn-dependent protease
MSDVRPRFLSEADCRMLASRLAQYAQGGGYSVIQIASTWLGTLRWARNQISLAGEMRDNLIQVTRNVNGAQGQVLINDTTDVALVAAARQAERLALMHAELPPQQALIPRLPLEPLEHPQLFSEATYQLGVEQRADAAIALAKTAEDAGMLSAGDINVMARSLAVLDSVGRVLYYPYTYASYRVTVRDQKGTASGWAGLSHHDWSKLDAAKLTAVALDKCIKSQNLVRVEPGRYTAILEPQAVGDLITSLFWGGVDSGAMLLGANLGVSSAGPGPFNRVMEPIPFTRLGERVVDERITISADPNDPELGIIPFSLVSASYVDLFTVHAYHPVTWIDKGVLTHLAYNRSDAIDKGERLGMPNSGAFRMTGGTTSTDEMIATTKRGILVTRFDQPMLLNWTSQLYRGYTRDGLWLIENGKITRPIKNLAFTESALFVLNNIEQLGVPQRIYSPPDTSDPFLAPSPRIAPTLKVRDFSFTAITDAV